MQDIPIREEILRRAEIAAPLLGWSDERLAAFREELRDQAHVPGRRVEFTDPSPFGLTEEDVTSPGLEAGMGADLRARHGRYDAARTFASWDLPDPAPETAATALALALAYCNGEDVAVTDPEEVTVREGIESASLATCFDGDPVAWLAREHVWSLEDGRSGYADLLLEKIRTPNVILEYEGGRRDIADGWHRTAAAIATGALLTAVIVPLPEPGADPGFEM